MLGVPFLCDTPFLGAFPISLHHPKRYEHAFTLGQLLEKDPIPQWAFRTTPLEVITQPIHHPGKHLYANILVG